jgi:hypothetical protein
VVVLRNIPTDRFHQVEVDGLVVASAGPAEPIRDFTEGTDQPRL